MLGYTETDIYKMMASINLVIGYIPQNDSNNEIINGLHMAYNFLDGMLVEGRI